MYSYKDGDASKVAVIDEGKISRHYDVPGSQVGFLGSDFYGESFILGEPIHFKINSRRNYVALMQVPPFHIDFIPQI